MIIRPVVLAGGSGTRMWPVSRLHYPKQFADLFGDACLFVRTLDLVADRSVFAAPMIVANAGHKFLILDILSRLGITDATILLEPMGRNTAAAAIAAAVAEKEADALHLVLASDHVIAEPKVFLGLVAQAKAAAEAGYFNLFGIQPDHPETGYGYIIPGENLTGMSVCAIERFVEKPARETAEKLIAKGGLWNGGIFFYALESLRAEAAALAPETLALAEQALRESKVDFGCIMLAKEPYGAIESQPFDRAIMEKTAKGSVVAGRFGWSDVGSWKALWAISDKDATGTTADGPVVMRDVKNSYLKSHGPTLAVMGVENLTVVATKDAVLVMPLDRAQDLRELVGQIEKSNGNLVQYHTRVQRPWGSYEGIAVSERFQVKHIVVLPGRAISLQKHHHRAEHWVIVNGTAKVERDGVETMVYPNQSIFIPIGAVHRLSNPGKVDLQLIEVQSGDYIGEDDIVRFSDNYGRS